MLNYRYYQSQSTTEDTVAILHGLLGSHENWHSQAKRLAQDKNVVSIDLRNHGNSPHVEGMSYKKMAEDVLELFEHLPLSTPNLLGHSMGGKVAMYLALHYPRHFKKLIVVDIAPKRYPPRHLSILQAMNALPISTIKTRKEADDWLAATIKTPVERAFLLKNMKRNAEGFYWQPNLPEITRHYLNISSFPTPTGLSFSLPTLFIGGKESDYLTPSDIPLLKQHFPQSTFILLENAGHLPHVDQPDTFFRHITDFLKSAPHD